MRRYLTHPYCLLLLTVLFWSGNWVVGRGFREQVPPVALAFWRWSIALACVLPFVWSQRALLWPTWRAHWPILLVLGLLGIGAYNTLTYFGLQFTTATNGVLLNSGIPVVIMVLNAVFFQQALQRREVFGMVMSLSGVLVIVAHGEWARLAALQFNRGDLWIMVSVWVWAAYTVLLRRRPAGVPPMVLLCLLVLVGLMGITPFYAWEMALGRHVEWSLAALTGIFPAFLGYVFWNKGVAEVGGNIAGLFIHLMPVATPLLSAVFLGEAPQLYHLLGMILILGGIFTAARLGAGLKPRSEKSD